MSVHLKIVHIIGKRIVRQLSWSVCPALFGKVGKREGISFNCLIPLTLLDLQKKRLCPVGLVFFQQVEDKTNLEGFAFFVYSVLI